MGLCIPIGQWVQPVSLIVPCVSHPPFASRFRYAFRHHHSLRHGHSLLDTESHPVTVWHAQRDCNVELYRLPLIDGQWQLLGHSVPDRYRYVSE